MATDRAIFGPYTRSTLQFETLAEANQSIRSEDEHLEEVIAAVPPFPEPLPMSARLVLPDDQRLRELEIRTTVYEDEDQTQETRDHYLSSYHQELRFLTDGLKRRNIFREVSVETAFETVDPALGHEDVLIWLHRTNRGSTWFIKGRDIPRGPLQVRSKFGLITGIGWLQKETVPLQNREVREARGRYLREWLTSIETSVSPPAVEETQIAPDPSAETSSSKDIDRAQGETGELRANRNQEAKLQYSSLVKEVQVLLFEAGYDPGATDGLPGPQTVAAVKKFQSDAGLEPTGQITQELAIVLALYIATIKSPEPKMATATEVTSTGSGFVVNRRGHVITNAHVVGDCVGLAVQLGESRQPAKLIALEERDDLALLLTDFGETTPARLRESGRIELGEQVVVAGFPLFGLLSQDLTITSGTISALAGMANDRRHVQISAPVQMGNSGGPLIDANGSVAGVVVSKIDAAKLLERTGDIPQNINFAIKATILRAFLDSYGVDYETASSSTELTPKAIAAGAREYTALVLCLN